MQLVLKKEFLLSLSIKELRTIGKKHNISVKSLYKKSGLVTLIHKHFFLVNNNEEVPILS